MCGKGGSSGPSPTLTQASPISTQQNINQNTAQQQNYAANPLTQQAVGQALWQGQSAAAQPFNLQPQQIAPFAPMQQQGFQQLQNIQGMTDPYFGQARNLMGAGAADVSAAGTPLTQGDISQYLNPYGDAALANMKKYVFDPQRTQMMGQQTQMAGGVGADRLALASQNIDKTQADAVAQAMAGYYGNAAQIAQGQQGAQLQAGMGLGNLGTQFGGLGTAAQGAGLGATGALLQGGAQQQQNYQQALNAQYQNALMQQAYPFQSAQFMAGIAGGLAPALGGTTTGQGATQGYGTGYQYPSQPAYGSQLLGAGIAGLGALGSTGLIGGSGSKGGTTLPYGMGYTDASGTPIYGPGFRGGGRIPMQGGGQAQIYPYAQQSGTGPDNVHYIREDQANDPSLAANFMFLDKWLSVGGTEEAWNQAHSQAPASSSSPVDSISPTSTASAASPTGDIASQSDMAQGFGSVLQNQFGLNPFGPGAPPPPAAPPPTPEANYTPTSREAWAPPQWTPADYSRPSAAPVATSRYGGRLPFARGGEADDDDSGGDSADIKVLPGDLRIPHTNLPMGSGAQTGAKLDLMPNARFPLPWTMQQTQSQGSSSGSSGTTDTGNIISGGLRLAAAVLPFALSDRRYKTDISKLGKDKQSGVPLYAYRYKGDPKSYPKVVGPMAQDVEKMQAQGGPVRPFDVGQGFQEGGFSEDPGSDFTFNSPDYRSFTGEAGDVFGGASSFDDRFSAAGDTYTGGYPSFDEPTTKGDEITDTGPPLRHLGLGEPVNWGPGQYEAPEKIAAGAKREDIETPDDAAPFAPPPGTPPGETTTLSGQAAVGRPNRDMTADQYMMPRSQMPFAGARGKPSPWEAMIHAGAAMMGSSGQNLGQAIGTGLSAGQKSIETQRKQLMTEEEINQKSQSLYQQAKEHLDTYTRKKPHELTTEQETARYHDLLDADRAERMRVSEQDKTERREEAERQHDLQERYRRDQLSGRYIAGEGPDPNDPSKKVPGIYQYDPDNRKWDFNPAVTPTPKGGASAKEYLFKVKQEAWLKEHPGDTTGALEFASGRRQVPEAQLKNWAATQAQKEVTANPSLDLGQRTDAWLKYFKEGTSPGAKDGTSPQSALEDPGEGKRQSGKYYIVNGVAKKWI